MACYNVRCCGGRITGFQPALKFRCARWRFRQRLIFTLRLAFVSALGRMGVCLVELGEPRQNDGVEARFSEVTYGFRSDVSGRSCREPIV